MFTNGVVASVNICRGEDAEAFGTRSRGRRACRTRRLEVGQLVDPVSGAVGACPERRSRGEGPDTVATNGPAPQEGFKT